VKVALEAAMFGQALALSALRDKKAPALARLIATDGAVSISSCDGNITIKTTVAATIFESGEIAVSVDRLGALLNAFAPSATVLLTASKGAVLIASGNGRYRLRLAEAPAALAIAGNAAEIEISTADLLTLFEPVATAGTETTRLYLCGVYLHSFADRLYAVATDGVTMLRTSIEADNLTTGTIIPTGAVTIMARLIRRTRPDKVSLRRSDTLFEVIAPAFTFTTRLIDATYPDYQRVIFAVSANVAICASADLSSALARLAAVADAGAASPLVALQWAGGKPLSIFLPRQPDDGADALPAETTGDARIALSLSALVTLVAEFRSAERLRL
jgi:DNA polymerase-3 subunit beta